jgi:hypothetical protein
MAIAIEAITVVVRNEAIQHRYPGGAEAFQMNVPNNTFCADDSLSCVSFMVESDAKVYFDELESMGLDISSGNDAVICDAFRQEIRPDCAWLQMGRYKQGTIAWIEGEEVRTIFGPPGWDPEDQRLNYAQPKKRPNVSSFYAMTETYRCSGTAWRRKKYTLAGRRCLWKCYFNKRVQLLRQI